MDAWRIVLAWVQARVAPECLAFTALAVWLGVQVLKAAVAQIRKAKPAFLAGFDRWPLVADVLGALAGLALIEPSLWGALGGVAIAWATSGAWDRFGKKKAAAGAPAAPGPAAAVLVALALSALVIFSGCMAPSAVREGQALEQDAVRSYASNNRIVFDQWVNVYRRAREADISYTEEKVIARIKAEVTTPAQYEIEIRALLAQHDKAKGDTERVVSKMRQIYDTSEGELRKALSLGNAVKDWLEAGIDTSAVPAMIDEVTALLLELYPPKATAPPK